VPGAKNLGFLKVTKNSCDLRSFIIAHVPAAGMCLRARSSRMTLRTLKDCYVYDEAVINTLLNFIIHGR
jgi:hypothetical protein